MTFRIYAIAYIVITLVLNIIIGSLVTFLLGMSSFGLLMVLLFQEGRKNLKGKVMGSD